MWVPHSLQKGKFTKSPLHVVVVVVFFLQLSKYLEGHAT